MAPVLLQTRLALLFAAYFCSAGLFLPYWPVWLKAQGFATDQTALVLGIFPWLTVICGPLMGRVADKTGARRAILRVLAGLFLSGYLLILWADAPWQIVALMVLIGASGAPFNAVVDNLTLIAVSDRKCIGSDHRHLMISQVNNLVGVTYQWRGITGDKVLTSTNSNDQGTA